MTTPYTFSDRNNTLCKISKYFLVIYTERSRYKYGKCVIIFSCELENFRLSEVSRVVALSKRRRGRRKSNR